MKKKPNHICLEHEHNAIGCDLCSEISNAAYAMGVKHGRNSVNPAPYWYKVMIALLIGLGVGELFGWSYPDWKPIIEQPYAVYRPDKETDVKLADCQDSWKSDQIEKKLLRLKIKRMELPDGQ